MRRWLPLVIALLAAGPALAQSGGDGGGADRSKPAERDGRGGSGDAKAKDGSGGAKGGEGSGGSGDAKGDGRGGAKAGEGSDGAKRDDGRDTKAGDGERGAPGAKAGGSDDAKGGSRGGGDGASDGSSDGAARGGSDGAKSGSSGGAPGGTRDASDRAKGEGSGGSSGGASNGAESGGVGSSSGSASGGASGGSSGGANKDASGGDRDGASGGSGGGASDGTRGGSSGGANDSSATGDGREDASPSGPSRPGARPPLPTGAGSDDPRLGDRARPRGLSAPGAVGAYGANPGADGPMLLYGPPAPTGDIAPSGPSANVATEYPPPPPRVAPDPAPELARPAGPARTRRGPVRRATKSDEDAGEDDTPDAGVRDGGPIADFVGPPVRGANGEKEEGVRDLVARIVKTQWSLLRVLLFAFIVFRIAAWFVRRAARANHQLALVLSRLWVFVEATGWAVIAAWIFTRLSQTESTVTAGLAGVVVLALIALSWGAIKDVIAGLMISAERPFVVGDYVRIDDAAGQVKSFRTRVLELETDDGHVLRVPYRDVGGATDVRRGGHRTAHAVSLTLELPESLDANEALEIARELAASSPWSVLGASPKLRLDIGAGAPAIVMEAYAFDREAGPMLYADLLSGWREAQRKSA